MHSFRASRILSCARAPSLTSRVARHLQRNGPQRARSFDIYTTRSLSLAVLEKGDILDSTVSLPLSDAQRPTIFALASAPGRAGVAVIRLSGPDALHAYENMIVSSSNPLKPWTMRRCTIIHPHTREELDDGLCVFFKGPRSFTGEDVLELHIHGGRAVPAAVLRALSSMPSLRPAEPGEFSRRAYLAGQMDIAQAEALIDLVDAETEGQRIVARRGVSGETSKVYDKMRTKVIRCLAMVEALIDFGEGEDIEEGVLAQAQELASDVRMTISGYLSDNRRGEIMRSGIKLAIFGPPNAGKSSLLNFLAQREAAIVTAQAGTTRDVLEVALDIGGIPVRVSDTAGLRDAEDLVERIGVERARQTVAHADLSLLVVDARDLVESKTANLIQQHVMPLLTPSTLLFVNKIDSIHPESTDQDGFLARINHTFPSNQYWAGSIHTGAGMPEFISNLAEHLRVRFDPATGAGDSATQAPLITHARHRAHLEKSLAFLDAFSKNSTHPGMIVCAAEDLRYAARAIGQVTGTIETDDVLDAVFGQFCIGK